MAAWKGCALKLRSCMQGWAHHGCASHDPSAALHAPVGCLFLWICTQRNIQGSSVL
jgi:hypothetical protein